MSDQISTIHAEPRSITWTGLLPLLPVVAVVLGYINSYSAPFVFDDASLPQQTNGPAFFSAFTLIPRGLVNWTFQMNLLLDGGRVSGYRVVNIAVHVLAALCLFGIIRRTLELPRFAGRFEGRSAWLAAVISTLWAIHPVQTQSVTYICQRYECMMGLFYLLTLYAFVRALASSRPRVWTDIAIASCILGIGGKQDIVTAPLAVLFYDYVFVSGAWRVLVRERWKTHLALFASWIVLFFSMLLLARYSTEDGNASLVVDMPRFRYFLSESGVLLHYIRIAIFPTGLCIDYAWPLVDRWSQAIPQTLAITALGVWTLWGVTKRKPIAYAGLWFFLTLAPTSSLLPVADVAVDHRMYLALAGVIACVVFAADRLLVRAPMPLRFLLPLVSLMALGLTTVERNNVFGSSERMFRDIVSKRPENFRQRMSLITLLLDQSRIQEAEVLSRPLVTAMEAVRDSPSQQYRLAASNYQYLYPEAMSQLGRILMAEGKPKDAIVCFQKAIAVGPKPYLKHNLSAALYQDGRLDEALQVLNAALTESPDDAGSCRFMGVLMLEKGRYVEAVTWYRKAIALLPHKLVASQELAWIEATCPDAAARDGADAIRLATLLCNETSNRSYVSLDTLAAAYAEAGRFDDATAAARQALALATQAAAGATNEIKSRLDAYIDHKAFRAEPTATNSPAM